MSIDIDYETLDRLAAQIGDDAKREEPMWRHTSFRVGGPAALFVRARTSSLLETLVPLVASSRMPWRVLGGATNVLVADAGVRQCIISVDSDRADLELVGERRAADGGDEVLVRFPAGVKLILAARKAVENGLAGLEWAVGLPGTLGGAVVNNAGAHGSDMASILEYAITVNSSGTIVRLRPDDMEYRYRYSAFKAGLRPGVAIMSVDLWLRRSSRDELLEVANRFETTRKQRQPPGLSAGSVFKNPPGDYSGRLIEAAGLKGTKIGGAQVSTLHGNFFLNTGGATAGDLYRLIRTVQDEVWRQFQVWLEPEVEMLGEWTAEERAELRTHSSAAGTQPSVDADARRRASTAWAENSDNPDYETELGIKEE